MRPTYPLSLTFLTLTVGLQALAQSDASTPPVRPSQEQQTTEPVPSIPKVMVVTDGQSPVPTPTWFSVPVLDPKQLPSGGQFRPPATTGNTALPAGEDMKLPDLEPVTQETTPWSAPTQTPFPNSIPMGLSSPADSRPGVHLEPPASVDPTYMTPPASSQYSTVIRSTVVDASAVQRAVHLDNEAADGESDTTQVAQLMREFRFDSSSHVAGTPVTLVEMMRGAQPSQRGEMVKQYWATFSAAAECLIAADHLEQLRQLGQGFGEVDSLLISAALSVAQDELSRDELRLSQAQFQLSQFARLAGGAPPLVPASQPLVGRYLTNFDVYATRGPMPERLGAIHQWLPRQRALFESQAATAMRCRAVMQKSQQEFARGSNPLSSTILACQLYRDQCSEVLKSVMHYNNLICQYALTVMPDQVDPEKIVAMLIPSPASSGEAAPPVRQAQLNQPLGMPRSVLDQTLGDNPATVPAGGQPPQPFAAPGFQATPQLVPVTNPQLRIPPPPTVIPGGGQPRWPQ